MALFLCASASGQTTEFTYQGRLNDGTMPAAGSYDFEFRLFDVDIGGVALGTQTLSGVPVAGGIFTVRLDFGSVPNFRGSDRWLEIAVRTAGVGSFTTLSPRQPVTSAPYSIRSLSAGNAETADTAINSLNLGGVAVNQYVLTSDTRLSDARNPLPGSANYIQNTTTQQPVSNFNITGDGSANLFNAATFYSIGGSRVLSIAGTSNIFAGAGAGAVNTGNFNAFLGASSGAANSTGFSNSFFGSNAGASNTTGSTNAFFGTTAGQSNTTGNDNAFFGTGAGFSNTTGSKNAFFGRGSATSNTTSSNNSFFGYNAGTANTTGTINAFFGTEAGGANVSGSANSFFGYRAGFANTASGNSFVGNFAGASNTSGGNNVFVGNNAGFSNMFGSNNVFVGNGAGSSHVDGDNNTLVGSGADVDKPGLEFATAIGAGARVAFVNRVVLGRINDHVEVTGSLSVGVMLTGASPPLCRNMSDGRIGSCASSLRYKEDVETFIGGLEVVRRLRPITFTWKDGGRTDVGFAAEEVEQIEPLLTTYNDKGQIEGVKYAQITTVLVNAVNEQQTLIEAQKQQLNEQNLLIQEQQRQFAKQQNQIDDLKRIICRMQPQLEACGKGAVNENQNIAYLCFVNCRCEFRVGANDGIHISRPSQRWHDAGFGKL
jgi:hypothetical protein